MPLHDSIDRSALRRAYRHAEEACAKERIQQAAPATAMHEDAAALAAQLIIGARKTKASGIDAFLHQYGLDTEEGIALMCLAEALLRVARCGNRRSADQGQDRARSIGQNISAKAPRPSSMPRPFR